MSFQEDFINLIKDDAVKQQQKYGIPAAIIIAQACLETGYGQYICKDMNTGKDSKNLFNIKGEGNNGYVLVLTKEYQNGVETQVQAKFKAYKTYEDSFADHAALFETDRYKSCMEAKDDPVQFAYKLKECGYATDPEYPQKLIGIMERYDLLSLQIDEIAALLDAFKEAGLLNSPALWEKVFKGEAKANAEYSQILLMNMMKKLNVDVIAVMVDQLKEKNVINTPALWSEVFKGKTVVNAEYAKIFLKNLQKQL